MYKQNQLLLDQVLCMANGHVYNLSTRNNNEKVPSIYKKNQLNFQKVVKKKNFKSINFVSRIYIDVFQSSKMTKRKKKKLLKKYGPNITT